jgi:hypothetical protein
MRVARQLTFVAFAGLVIALVIGCQGRSTIPAGANLERSGQGGPISYTADRTGDAYVLDSTKNEKVFEGQMHNGDQLVVEPGRDRIILAGNEAEHKIGLKPDHAYQIYFTPAH